MSAPPALPVTIAPDGASTQATGDPAVPRATEQLARRVPLRASATAPASDIAAATPLAARPVPAPVMARGGSLPLATSGDVVLVPAQSPDPRAISSTSGTTALPGDVRTSTTVPDVKRLATTTGSVASTPRPATDSIPAAVGNAASATPQPVPSTDAVGTAPPLASPSPATIAPLSGVPSIGTLVAVAATPPGIAVPPAPPAPPAQAQAGPVQGAPLPAVASASVSAPAPAASPEPAGRVFAAAIHLAVTGRDRRTPADDAPAALLPTPIADVVRDPAAPAPASAPAVDLTDHRWPTRMIERIEALRDDADAASTRVRFAPDALGPVEVHVRREGGATHLHFTAAQADTRALLQNAQPELARIAAERGVRLGGSSVGAGDGQPQRQPATPARFAAAPRARAASADPADAATDTRIA